jgi:PAS domain S-box-containing protein
VTLPAAHSRVETPRRRARRRPFEGLYVAAATGRCASEADDEEALLAGVTALIRDALRPSRCGFLLPDESGEGLRPARSFHGPSPHPLPAVPLGSGTVGAVAESGEPRRVDEREPAPDDSPVGEGGSRSEVCVPLKVGSRVLGVLDAQSERARAFDEEDERLLVVVASQVANALERLRSEAARRRGEELYRAYFTASPLAVFVSDDRGRYLEVNGAACALTGYGADELLRMSISDLLATDGAADLRARFTGHLALGGARHEVRIRRKDAQVRHCLVHAVAFGPDRLLGFLLDITDRREAEEKLRESEERFRGLSEASMEGILIHDGGRIVDVNQALCELGGYAWHELVGRDVFQLVAPEDRERVRRLLQEQFDRPYEMIGLRRDGSRIPLEVRARSFVFRGRVLRVGALRDMTERRRAEAVRETLIRDLAAKNVELERFTDAVSHDLKSPLITIRGFAEHLRADLRADRRDRLPEDALRVAEAAETLQLMLDHLVELSRAGRSVGPPGPVPLAEVVVEALQLVEGRRAASEVRVDISPDLPVVFGDHPRLLQVFQNLLDNAIKFSAPRRPGIVRVEARSPQGGDVTVVVRDNGVGIDPAHQERVFGPFEKLDPHGEGAGIGLALVRRIVEALGGRAWIQSRGRGEGCEVWVRLPGVPSPEGVASTESRAAAARRVG